ncbi:MAG: hypothetical protein P8O05_12765 [Flavobacteriales bacterium]|nr:hypothetical protein [Flavobacteriales bacterium]
MLKLRYCLILITICFTQSLLAQKEKTFPSEPEAFVKAMADFFGASKKEGKKFVEGEFEEVYLSGQITPDMQTIVVSTCNKFREAKFTAYPVFNNYLHAIMHYPSSNQDQAFFMNWHEVMYKMMEKKRMKKKVGEFLEHSASLFEKRIFYSTNAVQWAFGSDNYTFAYDSLPKIVYPEGTLIGYAKGDSTRVLNTKGIFFPTLERWFGEGGRVNWDRADFNPETTYATFENYQIRIKGSSYIVDSVLFYNDYFEQPLMGQLTEKVLANRTGEDASYPRFESYNKRLEIKNLFDNVDYDGGFTMRGSKLAGTGTDDEPAQLIFYREGEAFFTAQSLEFTIRPERFSSSHTRVLFRIEEDSIYHPDVSLKFDRGDRRLVLLRTDEGLSKSPYFNSYHNVDMRFEALYWNIDDPMIEMGSIFGSTQHFAVFESNAFYKKERYDSMIGIGLVHPLIEIRDFTRKINSNSFYAYELAGFLRLSEEQGQIMLINLANAGFCEFDLNTNFAIVNEKLFHYIDNSAGKRDYDVIQFNSEVDGGNNAQLNLLNYNLLLKGVGRIALSDSQNVNIFPSKEEVLLKKNRDFKFGGRVWAGNFEFIGKDYYFDYEEFKIDLLTVDSCRIYVEDENSAADLYGNKNRSRIKNVLEEINGTLKIDSPTNKGGNVSSVYPQYPILTSASESYVYYDNSNIQDGVYDRDRFYYQVEPFTIDSLDNFSRKDLAFQGTLVSGGIFPDIEEPLTLMEDNSLGFDVNTSSGGLPLYKGKGQFTADITLNYTGLQGNGTMDYLTSSAESEQFIFLPDSTVGRTTAFLNNEKRGGKEVPKAQATEVDIVFNPVGDYLTATNVEEPIVFFDDEAVLDGTLKLKPSGMRGKGDMSFDGATLNSLDFEYTARKILADTSNFVLAQTGMENLAFKTDNVSADVDFDERMGEFKSNDVETKIEFPTNQYICFMDEFKWFMDRNDMELTSSRTAADDFVIDTSDDAAKSNFFSINELQDSLNFLAPNAIYDVDNSVITCKKIKFISVADSRVIPDSGKVLIRKRAKMDPLERAVVVSNYVTQYHRIFGANLQIRGRLDYEGEGDYNYVDENKIEQVIHIDKFEVDSTLQTVGVGKIMDEDAFTLSPFFEFAGDFELYANQENLTFEGGTRILHTCDAIDRAWFKFRAEIKPTDIYIPVDTNMRDVGMAKLGAGVMMADDSPIDVYGSFLSRKEDRQDEPLIDAIGFLYYDKAKKQYKIGSKEKIKQPKLPGNLVALNTESCEITGDGEINYQVDLGHIQLTSYGDILHNSLDKSTSISGVLGIDFFFDDGALKRISDQMEQWPGLQPVDITKTNYEKGIKEIMGLEASDKVISELTLNGQFKKVPQELQNTLFFADVKFVWDDVEESYVSEGTLGVGTLGKKQVFRYMKGKIELQKGRSADVMRVYLEFDPGNWIYLEYKLGIMNITSTDQDFLNILTELKDDKRRTKDDNGKFTFQVVASKKKRNDFVDRFREFD